MKYIKHVKHNRGHEADGIRFQIIFKLFKVEKNSNLINIKVTFFKEKIMKDYNNLNNFISKISMGEGGVKGRLFFAICLI